MFEARRIDDELWELPVGTVAGMRVPARVFADAELLAAIERDRSLEQLANVATLPGIVDAALAMPDIHQGYGFPVGGVAATSVDDGVISPGGVGYDINCGVRLLALPIQYDELVGDRRQRLVHELSRSVPVGTGGRGAHEGLRGANLGRVLSLGPRALLEDLEIG
jgi:tRNA-splicing ligase RtcB